MLVNEYVYRDEFSLFVVKINFGGPVSLCAAIIMRKMGNYNVKGEVVKYHGIDKFYRLESLMNQICYKYFRIT